MNEGKFMIIIINNLINCNSEEEHINKLLNEIEENEQNQVDYFYNNFDFQNAQLKEISKLF